MSGSSGLRPSLLALAAGASLAVLVACSGGASTATSPGTVPPDQNAAPDGSTLKIGAPVPVSPINNFQFPSQAPIVLTLTNVSGTFISFPVTYEVELRNAAGTLLATSKFAKTSGNTTSFTVTSALAADSVFSWRVRATSNGRFGPWSSTATFRTSLAAFITGSAVNDPLTTGATVGRQRGGHFVAGQGWQSDTANDGIDYDISTCQSCRVEFDVTNVGNGIGNPGDMKWLTMGDATKFDDFGLFRDHLWKMTLEQRGDGDGTAMKLVWRNGGIDDGDPGDHVSLQPASNAGGPAWSKSRVFHFIIQWTRTSFSISVDGQTWFAGTFAVPYAPPNHRISLGCYPRNETLVGVIWRNLTVTPQ